jgi:hypothetical protein
MICNWRWFIQAATAIGTNRKRSRTLGILLAHYREHHVPGHIRDRPLTKNTTDVTFVKWDEVVRTPPANG